MNPISHFSADSPLHPSHLPSSSLSPSMASLSLPSFSYYLFFIITPLFFSYLIFQFTRKLKSNPLNLPPGPPGWPFVGNLYQIGRSGKPFIHIVKDLRKIYGPIFSLKMGTRTLIIVSNAELAHEALVEKGQVFASRPRENPTRSIFSCNKFTINSATYGPVWRSLRRNMVSGMLSTSRLREFRPTRESAMDRFINRLRVAAESGDGSVWVLQNARFAVFTILLFMCFGVDMDEDLIIKVEQVMKKVLVVLEPRMDDFLPILSPWFSKQRKHVMEVREEQMQILLPLIQRRRSILRNSTTDYKRDISFAYLDTLFDLEVEGRKSWPSDEELVTLCSEFLNGGTDTTATALEWGIGHLIENQKIQAKIYDEIATVVGDRKVDEGDLEKMAYLNAFSKELLRKHPPTYFVLTHAVTESATLGGYDIPVDANVEFYIPPISEDPKLWSDPLQFNPDRFVSGKEEADITGVTGVKMMPFGVGRRICPGLGMATLHINLMVARMVQEFEWLNLPSQRTVDVSERFEFTVVMKTPLRAVLKPRK